MLRIHPTAMIEANVQLGDGTSVWDNVHIRQDTVLGEQCIVGGKSTIAYEVKIGNRVKINSNAYLCNGVTLEDGVMISAGVIFTNDRGGITGKVGIYMQSNGNFVLLLPQFDLWGREIETFYEAEPTNRGNRI